MMVRFIDAHRDAYGVEPICDVRPIAPGTTSCAPANAILSGARGRRAAMTC
jgi:hypothetical protein